MSDRLPRFINLCIEFKSEDKEFAVFYQPDLGGPYQIWQEGDTPETAVSSLLESLKRDKPDLPETGDFVSLSKVQIFNVRRELENAAWCLEYVNKYFPETNGHGTRATLVQRINQQIFELDAVVKAAAG